LNDSLDDFQGDAIGNRIYDIKSDTNCSICKRSLKNKVGYLTTENKFRCHDTSNDEVALESTICLILGKIHEALKPKNIRLSKVTIKKISKAISDQIE
jgi:hypothetical protein